jgi:hypothetical protein
MFLRYELILVVHKPPNTLPSYYIFHDLLIFNFARCKGRVRKITLAFLLFNYRLIVSRNGLNGFLPTLGG